VTYGIEHGTGRTAADVALDDPNLVVAAFARFVESVRPSALRLRL
jgi:hypothetical protein